MISEKMQSDFLDQINKELYSEYLYLSMKAYFANLNLAIFYTNEGNFRGKNSTKDIMFSCCL